MKVENSELNELKEVINNGTLTKEDIESRDYAYAFGIYLMLISLKDIIERQTKEEFNIKIENLEEWSEITLNYYNALKESEGYYTMMLSGKGISIREMAKVKKLKDVSEQMLQSFLYKNYVLKGNSEQNYVHTIIESEAIHSFYFYSDVFRYAYELEILIYKKLDMVTEYIEARRNLNAVLSERKDIEKMNQKMIDSGGFLNLSKDDQIIYSGTLREMFDRTSRLLNRRFFDLLFNELSESEKLN